MWFGKLSAKTMLRLDGGHAESRPTGWNCAAKLQIHRLACSRGLINGHQDFYVAQTFFAGDARRLVVQNTLREIVHLGGELIYVSELNFLTVTAFALQVVIALSRI